MEYKIIKICTGAVQTVTFHDQKPKRTAVNKLPITSPTFLSYLGLTGDEHEYKGHGGVNKAICLFDRLDYEMWKDYIDLPEYAMFGENITTIGLTKDQLAVGDVFQFGDAVIQVTEGRGPCSTIARKYNVPQLVKMMSAAHATGCYFRVLEEGMVQPDSQLTLLHQHPARFTIDEFNSLLYTDPKNKELLEKAMMIEALPDDHRQKFAAKLAKLK